VEILTFNFWFSSPYNSEIIVKVHSSGDKKIKEKAKFKNTDLMQFEVKIEKFQHQTTRRQLMRARSNHY
jgi:hypothetical protein